jgi:pimeloyl-ACP methyl ester carboxylesterase
MQLVFQSAFRLAFRLFAASFALSFAAWHPAHAATPQTFQDLQVEVVGQGRPMLMIPGLNSAAETWRETCEALQGAKVQCHLVQLPGFAGLPAVRSGQLADDRFLEGMRDRLLAYIKARGLTRPVVMGHSLGGVVALQMAIAQPDAIGELVIVDSLAFFGAVQNPAATEESVRPMADAMRKQMLAQDDASYRKGAENAIKGMAHDGQRIATLRAWSEASDRGTTTQAMYEMMTTDLRPQLARITTPTLLLGAWAAYAPYGSTKESTTQVFQSQYAKLQGVRIELSDTGYHFLMWDDPQWLQAQVRGFIGSSSVVAK